MTNVQAPQFRRGQLNVFRQPDDVTRVSTALRATGRRIALVPTMGALHDGHRELLRRAKRLPHNTVVAASIFVNPLQFGPHEDFDSYPRPTEDDLAILADAGVELVFMPSSTDLYRNSMVTINPGWLGDELEGAARPGHFAGVLTIVAKLFNIMQPEFSLFGEKDYQQLILIKKMVQDLNIATRVIGVPTVRERNGLALSSRNRYLSDSDKDTAAALSAALMAGAHVGRYGVKKVLNAAQQTLVAAPQLDIDYLELRAPDLEAAPAEGPARLLIAARIGNTRLIDNVAVMLGASDVGETHLHASGSGGEG